MPRPEEAKMTEQHDGSEPLERPDRIEAPDGSRGDGRPTGEGGDINPGRPHHDVPTEAPEEDGATPATEHAPGADL